MEEGEPVERETGDKMNGLYRSAGLLHWKKFFFSNERLNKKKKKKISFTFRALNSCLLATRQTHTNTQVSCFKYTHTQSQKECAMMEIVLSSSITKATDPVLTCRLSPCVCVPWQRKKYTQENQIFLYCT